MSSLQHLLNPMSSGPSTPARYRAASSTRSPSPQRPTYNHQPTTFDNDTTETESDAEHRDHRRHDDPDPMETESDRPESSYGYHAESDNESVKQGSYASGYKADSFEAMEGSYGASPQASRSPMASRASRSRSPRSVSRSMSRSVSPRTTKDPYEAAIAAAAAAAALQKPKKKKAPVTKKKGIAKPVVKKRAAAASTSAAAFNTAAAAMAVSGDETAPPKKKLQKAVAVRPGKKTDTTNAVGQPKYDKEGRELYCICRKPDTGKWMIGCDGCEDWYHGECVDIKEEDADLIDKYYCQYCTTPTLTTTWRRMCRLPSCRRPAQTTAVPPSKYCSSDHGILYMKSLLSRSTIPASEVASLTASVPSVSEFHSLGTRLPTPPPSALKAYPSEIERLEGIKREREALERRRIRTEQRQRYLGLVIRRKERMGGVCGFDEELAMDDGEWDVWVVNQAWASAPPSRPAKRKVRDEDESSDDDSDDDEIADAEEEVLEKREGVCGKKQCRGHKGWMGLFKEEGEVTERLREERLVQLKQEERRIRERQKRRALRNEQEGRVERDA
ncbi:hypothetical protein BZA77DRAFT_318013 [Pyronema omphalodes]|nr:hypothetical protein BZA77DRAFT_318013 [Pyronema omphalodes]